jgi:hypothetical protein
MGSTTEAGQDAKIEVSYTIQPVTKFVLIRSVFEDDGKGNCFGGSETCGEFDLQEQAERIRDLMQGKMAMAPQVDQAE